MTMAKRLIITTECKRIQRQNLAVRVEPVKENLPVAAVAVAAVAAVAAVTVKMTVHHTVLLRVQGFPGLMGHLREVKVLILHLHHRRHLSSRLSQ